jgi:NNP family nitrate/nitrite transporter-like MFS transporter
MWTTNILAVVATIFTRFIVGPMCDIYGPRKIMAIVLFAGAIPVSLVGTVTTYEGLCVVRFFIGIIGSTFVMSQYWTSQMFVKEIVGTANAIVGGWGNLGGGIAQLFMGSAMFPLFLIFFNGDTEKAWRSVFVVPAVLTMMTAVTCWFATDDSPKGNYDELKRKDEIVSHLIGATKASGTIDSGVVAFFNAMRNSNTIILMVQYGACFGVELTMNNAAATYFFEKFNQSQSMAAAIASSFGFMNIVARGVGGWLSDYLMSKLSMRGRLIAQLGCMLMEGVFILVFAAQNELGPAIVCLICFSIFVQAAEGSSYGIVPYVDPNNKGAVTGAVGAGGNMGAVCWGFIFMYGTDTQSSLETLGYIVLATSMLTFFIKIPGFSWLTHGVDVPEEQAVGVSLFGNKHKNLSVDDLLEVAKKNGVGDHDMIVMEGGPSGKVHKTFSSRDDISGMVASLNTEVRSDAADDGCAVEV